MPKTRVRKEHLRSQKIAAGHLKVAEHSFRALFVLNADAGPSARAQGFRETNFLDHRVFSFSAAHDRMLFFPRARKSSGVENEKQNGNIRSISSSYSLIVR